MLLGIDVGGTFTDAVLIHESRILAQGKCTTTHGAVLYGIMAALDKVLTGYDPDKIERVVISSTIVTNALTENKTDPVYLAVMPGPGMNIEKSFPVPPQILKGYVDHRGKVITAPDVENLHKEPGVAAAAISGKFAVRNQENEQLGAQVLRKLGYEYVFQGSSLSGELNFIRRTNSAYFAAAVARIFQEFCRQVKISLAERQIKAPVQILKADGGTLPLDEAAVMPEESIFTGPAASVLGIMALDTTGTK
jgi:N-methylhydantoinase A/oxoprolinase/acetone carboxylase beta subunit